MSNLARSMAPVLAEVRNKADDLGHQVEWHHIALEKSGAMASMRMQRENANAARQAASYHDARKDYTNVWMDRLTTSPGAARAARKEAILDAARHMQKMRDSAPLHSDMFFKAHAEFLRLSALAAA